MEIRNAAKRYSWKFCKNSKNPPRKKPKSNPIAAFVYQALLSGVCVARSLAKPTKLLTRCWPFLSFSPATQLWRPQSPIGNKQTALHCFQPSPASVREWLAEHFGRTRLRRRPLHVPGLQWCGARIEQSDPDNHQR